MKKAILLLIIALLIAAAVYWFFYEDEGSALSKAAVEQEQIAHANHDDKDEHGHDHEDVIKLSADQIKSLDIKVQEANEGTLSITLSARGKIILEPDRLAHILPKVSGVAKEGLKNIGDHVKKGEVLAVLESREIADTKANYLAAHEKERLALSLFEREQSLYAKKISSQQEFLQAQSTYEEAKINLLLAKAKLHAFGLSDEAIATLENQKDPDLRVYDIYSPIDGEIINRHITIGEFIETTATIYEIADLNKVWIEIGIYPNDLSKVKEGQTVQIKSTADNITANAKIIYVSPIVKDETITSKAIADLDNHSGKWRPGTFVQATIDTDEVKAPVVIPKDALQEIDGKNYVFLRVPEGFVRKEVEIGKGDRNHVEILSGLNPKEVYAVTNTFLLKAELGKSEAEHTHQ